MADDYFDRVADQILAKPQTKKATAVAQVDPPATVPPSQPERPRGLKRRLRRVVRAAIVETDEVATSDAINTVTNRVYKRVMRPALAEAFALGVDAGIEDMAKCCGCSGSGDPIINPYDGSEVQ